MKVIAKRQLYEVVDIACDKIDVNKMEVIVTAFILKHNEMHRQNGTVCEHVDPLPPCVLLVGPGGCYPFDTRSLQVAVAAQLEHASVDAWVVDIDALAGLLAEGGDPRKDIYVDGKPMFEYLEIELDDKEPLWDFSKVIDIIKEPGGAEELEL